MTSALPFDDFRALLATLPDPDETAAARMRTLFAKAGAPNRSLGRVEDIAVWLAAWSGRAPPAINRPLVAVFAGNHGVVRHGISAQPMQATAEAVELCAAGGAAVNQVCIASDLGLKVFDLALHLPTGDISEEAALDERGCAATMAFGMEALAGGTDLVCLGDLGVGNETVAAALFAAIFGGSGADWVEPDSDAGLTEHRVRAVDAALALHGVHLKDPLEALRRVGGREFAALAGAILAARMEKIPVLLGGHAALAAAVVLHAANPSALDHCRLAGLPDRTGPARVAARLGLMPLLDLSIDHHGGVDAALAAGLVKAAALVGSGMAAAVKR
ncbi:nicotinate-nucleotide--dimethylbenzimidazole phosphoribosyltransferase [Mesorhizobium sp. 8]|uniref:nicotinate-nucleotide--dimethylbenzimidazole phosphoribosyltransferase n=1 Tax=Mesorhizobium sp. 8 TaxID=2584466 RepID=UPI00111DCCBB|nr:nicotinate-nucleotide--dimethylbenzimidazole phosphoribosyltransferase [Mesorhizobium sp. 8]QDB99694.1 nicotinate-nucleotide--dimethylbenzimidazole phosphoribosyltransferase [Mesorhizobium sp. 8]